MNEIVVEIGPVAGVLLAGGQSRRMGGGDKCLCTLGGAPLLDVVAARLRPQTDALVLNANGDVERFRSFGFPIVSDCIPGFLGPLAGVLSGMAWVRQNCPQIRHIVTAACDTPFFPVELVATLRETANTCRAPVVVAASGGRTHPTFGLWSTDLAEAIHSSLSDGRRKMLDFIAEHNGVQASFAFDIVGGVEIDPFFNVNNSEDLSVAERVSAHINRA